MDQSYRTHPNGEWEDNEEIGADSTPRWMPHNTLCVYPETNTKEETVEMEQQPILDDIIINMTSETERAEKITKIIETSKNYCYTKGNEKVTMVCKDLPENLGVRVADYEDWQKECEIKIINIDEKISRTVLVRIMIPAYKNRTIEEPVKVKLELYRKHPTQAITGNIVPVYTMEFAYYKTDEEEEKKECRRCGIFLSKRSLKRHIYKGRCQEPKKEN